MFYVVINQQVEVKDFTQKLSLREMQNLVGEEGEAAYIEVVYHRFSDDDIAIICDEEFLLKDFSPTCRIDDVTFHGQVLVLSVAPEGEFCGLTESQVEIVKAETKLLSTRDVIAISL